MPVSIYKLIAPIDQKGSGQANECVVCGRRVKAQKPAWARLMSFGSHFATDADGDPPEGDMGWYVIGSECVKRAQTLDISIIPAGQMEIEVA